MRPAKDALARLRQIALSAWDPIGLAAEIAAGQAPADEYDGALWRAWAAACAGADAATIAGVLERAEQEMGLVAPAAGRRRAARLILGLAGDVGGRAAGRRGRPYDAADRDGCLAVFDSNVPAFFAPCERADFETFLDGLAARSRYLVLSDAEGRVVACGGLVRAPEPQEDMARLVWGMVTRKRQAEGWGTALVEARLAAARAEPGLRRLGLATGRATVGFYGRFGFVLTGVTPDGFGPGLDRCEMEAVLDPG